MKIENNKLLFFVNAGLTASGRNGYDSGDIEISALAAKIHAADFSNEIKLWFSRARTGQVEVNPYWPRGSMLSAACFFIDDAYAFDHACFFSFVKSTGVSDPIDNVYFESWILELPGILHKLSAHPAAARLWNEYKHITDTRSAEWETMLKSTSKAAEMFFGACVPEMVFCPNLFTPYSADFVRIGSRIITISSTPDAETMLHETLHTSVAEHRGQISAFAAEHGLGNFADKAKMMNLGYMADNSTESITHVIEECFVRALSVVLSGGSEARLQLHADFGCTSVPFIAELIRQMSTTSDTMPDLIFNVLNEINAI